MSTLGIGRELVANFILTTLVCSNTILTEKRYSKIPLHDIIIIHTSKLIDADLDVIDRIYYICSSGLQVEDDPRTSCSTKQKNSNYTDILKNTVLTKHRRNYIILMNDQLSVEQDIDYSAKPVLEVGIDVEL